MVKKKISNEDKPGSDELNKKDENSELKDGKENISNEDKPGSDEITKKDENTELKDGKEKNQ